jgi:hypothetical protein
MRVRLSLLLLLVMAFVMVPFAYLGGDAIKKLARQNYEKQLRESLAAIRHLLDVYEDTLILSANQQRAGFAAKYRGSFRLHPDQRFTGTNYVAPVLTLNGKALNEDTSIIRHFTDATGGTAATLFARAGNEFQRIATTLRRQDDSFATGTFLDKEHPALARLLGGEPYQGFARLFDRYYMTHYTPIFDDAGTVVGALFVGIDLTTSLSRKWFDVDAVYADAVVICLDGRHWRYPYTLEGSTVTLADPQEVVETYEPIREAVGGQLLRLVEAEGAPAGQVWEIDVIRAGLSFNNVFYPDAVLREAVPQFDGARIFVKSDIEHIKGAAKDVRQVVGWIEAPRFVEGAATDTGRIVATARLPGLPDTTRALLVEAIRAGKADLVGFSIDAFGATGQRMVEGKKVRAAKSITRVDSVDLIVEPGAGGRLVRLVEAAPESRQSPEESSMRKTLLQELQAKAPGAYAKINPDTATDDEVLTAYREAFAPPALAATPSGDNIVTATLAEVRMVEARMRARELIAAATLPQPAKDRLLADFAGRERFVEADVTAAIAAERDYLARFVESGRVNLGGLPGDIQVEDRSAKMAAMLDAFFDPQHKDHGAVGSFKEAYIEFTGDRYVTGRLSDADKSRLRESAGAHYREALDTTSWANALGDSIARRMQAVYAGEADLQAWRKVATVGRVNDFRTQERFRVGG